MQTPREPKLRRTVALVLATLAAPLVLAACASSRPTEADAGDWPPEPANYPNDAVLVNGGGYPMPK